MPQKDNPIDPDRTYEGWQKDFRGYNGTITTNNLMTGFCWDFSDYGKWGSTCPSYSYVQKSDVQPYFDIAAAYGFANYMFQSNQGPSLEAHQFLFTGTSAPVAPDDQDNYNWDFAADLVNTQPPPSGCAYTNSGAAGWPRWVQPNGVLENDPRSSECYTHDSLVTDANDCKNQKDGTDYCDRGIDGLPSIMAWGYYVEPGSDGGMAVWDAPAYIPEVCYGENSNTPQGTSCGEAVSYTHLLLTRDYNRSRSIDLLPPKGRLKQAMSVNTTMVLPLLGRIAAGQPIEAVENPETISLADFVRSKEVFVLEVRGDSMQDEHIMRCV